MNLHLQTEEVDEEEINLRLDKEIQRDSMRLSQNFASQGGITNTVMNG
jgi:hypothetical protein